MSILFTTEELNKLEPHPHQYVDMKTKYLEQISQFNYSKINQLPFISVAKAQHRQLMDKVKCFQFEERKQLNTNQFNTIFQEEKPITLEPEQLREEYYKEFIQIPSQQIITKKEIEKNRYLHVCGMINSTHAIEKNEYKKHVQELRELQAEINQMQQRTEKAYYPAKEMCRNSKLINKVATSMLNMYNVYFKEIFDCLIDEILLDEIQHLNEQQCNDSKNIQEKLTSFELPEELEDQQQLEQIEDVKELLQHLGNMLEDY